LLPEENDSAASLSSVSDPSTAELPLEQAEATTAATMKSGKIGRTGDFMVSPDVEWMSKRLASARSRARPVVVAGS
jgi:hypothetical protein